MSVLVNKFYDVSKLVLWGDSPIEGTDKKPKLVFSFRDGNPRLTVYTGVQGKEGVISFPSDYPTMIGILNILKDVVNSEPGTKFSIDSLTNVYENDVATKEKKVVSTLYIGKSKEGLIYFSVLMENKPKLVFTIKPSPYHIFKDSDKNIIPDSVISMKIANGIADFILNIISNIIVNYSNEEYKTTRKQTTVKVNNGQSSSTPPVQELDDLDL